MKTSRTVRGVIKKLVRDPLLHFLVIGAALFLVFQWQRPAAGVAENEILVSAGDVGQLLSGFERVWQRPPTGQELAGLVDNFVREEIYCREARSLGLDQGDVVVRKRLRQKLEFLLQDVARLTEPSDDDLTRFMAQSPDRYRYEPKFAFQQVYLNPDLRGADLEQELERLLARLNNGAGKSDGTSLPGDPSLLPRTVKDWSRSTIAANFGEEFADALENMEPGVWSGPVESSFGTHLVLLQDYRKGHLPALAEIRKSVRSDWLAQRREELAEKSFRTLRERYRVTIDAPEAYREALAYSERAR